MVNSKLNLDTDSRKNAFQNTLLKVVEFGMIIKVIRERTL